MSYLWMPPVLAFRWREMPVLRHIGSRSVRRILRVLFWRCFVGILPGCGRSARIQGKVVRGMSSSFDDCTLYSLSKSVVSSDHHAKVCGMVVADDKYELSTYPSMTKFDAEGITIRSQYDADWGVHVADWGVHVADETYRSDSVMSIRVFQVSKPSSRKSCAYRDRSHFARFSSRSGMAFIEVKESFRMM